MNGRQRLALCLLASTGLHVLALVASAPGLRFAPTTVPMRVPPVTVSFVGRPVTVAPPPDSPPLDRPPLPSAPSRQPANDAPPLDRAIRLLTPPDFSEVEMLPTPVPIRLRYEFHVGPDGMPADLVLLQSSPVPADLMPVIERALRSARFAPAVSAGRPVAGRFEMNVEIDPASPVLHLGPGSRRTD